MNIVVYSSTFYPNVGGLESIMTGLAEEWSAMGHHIIVYTLTPQSTVNHNFSFKVYERKSILKFYSVVKKADVYIEANISLKSCIIGLLNRKKWFVVHHTHYDHQNRIIGFFKNQLAKFANNICVSEFISKKIPSHSFLIHNFYSPIFGNGNQITRNYDFVYLGRLVSDKGVDKLCNALLTMEWTEKCLIIGDGEERTALENLVVDKGLSNKIEFVGAKNGMELVHLLNQSKVLVIPSVWDEPFGVVALEGMACGCIIACSNKQGLIEATGQLAFIFDPNDEKSMQEGLMTALAYRPTDTYHESVKSHLQKHQRRVIAQQYLDYFASSCL